MSSQDSLRFFRLSLKVGGREWFYLLFIGTVSGYNYIIKATAILIQKEFEGIPWKSSGVDSTFPQLGSKIPQEASQPKRELSLNVNPAGLS